MRLLLLSFDFTNDRLLPSLTAKCAQLNFKFVTLNNKVDILQPLIIELQV